MGETYQEGSGAGADFDLSQFYQIFFEEAGENLDQMEQMLLNLDLSSANDEELNGIFRCAHSIKGGSATFGFSDVAELTHQMESLLDRLRRALDERGTLEVLFSQRVQTLTDMSELRTTLGDLRRTEKNIIINFNNSVEVSALRESWAKTLASLRKRLADVRQVQSGDAEFVASIDKSLDEIKQYETGISPIFEKIEGAQLDGAGGGDQGKGEKVLFHSSNSRKEFVKKSQADQIDYRLGFYSNMRARNEIVFIKQ